MQITVAVADITTEHTSYLRTKEEIGLCGFLMMAEGEGTSPLLELQSTNLTPKDHYIEISKFYT
jgi:hypothetical protein